MRWYRSLGWIRATKEGVVLDCGYRTDFLVDHSLIIELKAVTELLPLYEAQWITYLKLRGLSLGFLINFNVPVLKDGVRRIVWGPLFRG